MNYELKDKISITKELLSELEMKGWQEIEYLQAQIANLTDNAAGNKLRQLLKNLLISYYIFTGGIENLSGEPIDEPIGKKIALEVSEPVMVPEITESESVTLSEPQEIDNEVNEISDPFEYFVDFDDPIGEPLTDKDLYNN